MDEIDDRVLGYRIAQTIAIQKLHAINEDGHVVPQPALIVENVAARLFVDLKVAVQQFADRGARNFPRRTRDVALDVLREADRWHSGQCSTKIFSRSSAASHWAERPSRH